MGCAKVSVPDRERTGLTASPGRYADVPEDEALVLYGSEDTLEVAVNGGNAARELGLRRGDRVTVSAGARKGPA